MPLAAVALLMLGQAAAEKPPVSFFTSEQLEQALQAAPGNALVQAARLLSTPEYGVMEIRRTAPEKSEVHVAFTDIWYVVRGSATLVTGGTMVEAVETEPGELRGRGVAGGDSRRVRGGDVVVVPPGVPHWISAVEGPEVVYLVVKVPAPAPYREPYRPQYHFSPAVNWTNDPNGLVYYAGEYHLFYQYNPFGNVWGHMSWGHAVSRDLVHWEHLPVAIPEVDGVMAFSGSAVVDWKNTSGFGRGGEPPLVAVYTGYREKDKNQSQYLAYSTDKGRTWTRHAKNPVIDIGSTEFRDPKVFWHAPQRKWIMVLSLAAEHRMRFYGSPDLKQWTELSEFGPAGATGGVWECPDLFELPVDGDPKNTRWVLIVNLNPGAIAGGSGTQYFVGRFDGTRFVPDDTRTRWADYGKDFYAAVSWSDVPAEDGRRLWIGWMNNWLYGNQIPTSPWRSAQSLPRTLALRTTADGIRLVQQPIEGLKQLRGAVRRADAQAIPEGTLSLASQGIAGKALEIVAEFEVGSATEFGLKVRTGGNEETRIGIDPRAGQLFVDRTKSGQVAFQPDFTGRHSGPLTVNKGRVRLHVFVDWSSVEVFGPDGETVLTDQVFPSAGSEGVALYAVGGSARLVSLEAWPVRSIWGQ